MTTKVKRDTGLSIPGAWNRRRFLGTCAGLAGAALPTLAASSAPTADESKPREADFYRPLEEPRPNPETN